jgi:SAM-dependent methyltransferase
VLTRVHEMISLERTSPEGGPNTGALNEAVRNIDLISLNVKSFGYDLARSLAEALPRRDVKDPGRIGLRSKPSTQADMEADWTAYWCAQLQIPVIFARKIWEYCYVLQALHEAGLLAEGVRGLGFGCGREPIPSYLASRGVSVTVTDQSTDEAVARGWATTGQHVDSLEQAFHPHLVTREAFDRLVSFRVADMNAIPAELSGFDFCWSICAMEHLGSIAAGLAFVENTLAALRPGGISIHTTEFNMLPDGPTIDNWPTVLFQRRHIEKLAERLRSRGHHVAEMDFDAGDKPMDRFIDLPPWGSDLPDDFSRWHADGAHLKLAIDGFPATCFGIVVTKAG